MKYLQIIARMSIPVIVIGAYEVGKFTARDSVEIHRIPAPGQLCKPVIRREYIEPQFVKDCHNIVSGKDHCTFVGFHEFNREVGYLKQRAETVRRSLADENPHFSGSGSNPGSGGFVLRNGGD